MNKNNLLKKLEQLSLESAPKINFTNEELAYLRTKIRNDQLGLMLNYVEQDPLADSHHIMVKEPKIDLNINMHSNGGGSFLKHQQHHLLIEGDNYHGLLALAHAKVKVDIIYIDPPYNTGNKDFIYNDDFTNDPTPVGHDDPHRHSKWISFMKKRLELAKKLLSEEGVIFVSIDDNEQAYLKVLMDEIFGENNFIAPINWQSSFGGKNDTKLMPINSEYILFYGKQTKYLVKMQDYNSADSFKLKDEFFSKYGSYKISPLCWASLTYYAKLDYIIYIEQINDSITINNKKTLNTIGEIVAGSNKSPLSLNKEKRVQRIAGNYNQNDWCFYWSWEVVSKAFEQGFIELKNNAGKWMIFQKEYEKAKFSGRKKMIELRDFKRIALRNIIADSTISNKVGNDEAKFLGISFSYPKPTSLIKKLLSTKENNSVVLDFFAGSGTTGQAVMELNAEDDGHRRFILITNNESKARSKQEAKDEQDHPELGICRAVTRERLYRVIHGKGSKNEKIKWVYKKNKPSLQDNAVRYLQVDYVHKITGEFEEIDKNKSLYKVEFDQNLSILDLK